ncbi:hypothetical protein SK128_012465 [Halocaridina rubra]|uniref:Uncharacterized protein n=1 Tax=Halocaridina rubra TaxID=373956 RepID=A0AAN8WJD0_HALRR
MKEGLLGITLVLLIATPSSSENNPETCHNTLDIDDDILRVQHAKGQVNIDFGLTIPNGTEGVTCTEGDQCLDYGVAKVIVTQDEHCQKISWTATSLTELKDCIRLEGHWYGGGEQIRQPWPIEKEPRPETPFVTADMLQKRGEWYGGVSEAYWISSQGAAVRVEEGTPLFMSLPDNDGDSIADQLCFSAKQELPFAAPEAAPLTMNYYVCTGNDVKEAHMASYPKFFANPTGMPDLQMLTDPVWSTWAEYHTAVNDTRVWDFAMGIKSRGFNFSQVEIDDNWEACYGDAIFNPERFPDPKQLVDALHGEGFRVTLWTHPFINDDCPSYAYADQNGYFIKDENGTTQQTRWWQGLHAGMIDFTNEDAVIWWTQRLVDLQINTGIDSFKFDAGESSWIPDIFTLNVNELLWPNAFTTKYVDSVSSFGGMIETRVGMGTQRHPIFVRMLDKDSIWGEFNGLRTLVPSALHFGLLGYPYVLPDMIGGNAYVIKPNAELFIRWAQANTFMPALQFSILPWGFDENVTERCKEVTSLHTEIVPLMVQLGQEAMVSGAPIIRPTWWLCPDLEACLTADQQFLVGDNFLAAPVVYEGATTLDVVLPPGQWRLAATGEVYSGPITITLQDITIESIIYFTREATA